MNKLKLNNMITNQTVAEQLTVNLFQIKHIWAWL